MEATVHDHAYGIGALMTSSAGDVITRDVIAQSLQLSHVRQEQQFSVYCQPPASSIHYTLSQQVCFLIRDTVLKG